VHKEDKIVNKEVNFFEMSFSSFKESGNLYSKVLLHQHLDF